jgi:hypothetical protein
MELLSFSSGAQQAAETIDSCCLQRPSKFIASLADEMHGNFSPDGHLVAYTSNESGKFDVYVETLPRSDRKWPVSTNGGYEPRWRADGRQSAKRRPKR